MIDVVVIGGGNAAVCAALAAREGGAEVLLLERSSEAARGGNSKFTRNIRCVHRGTPYSDGEYSEEELVADLVHVTGEKLDIDMARFTARESASLLEWMEHYGARWQTAFKGTLQLTRTNHFFLGGGKALLNNYYRTAQRMGITVAYETTVERVVVDGTRLDCVVVEVAGETKVLHPKAVVVASGGFESNFDWLKRHWGAAADNFLVRGTSMNDGRILASLLEQGAQQRGNPKGFHAIAVDARSPKYEGGIVTRVDAIPFSVTVNRDGQRFYDEGEDAWPKRYAVWGGLIARQPGQIAYSIFDDQVVESFIPPVQSPVSDATLEGLAGKLGIDAQNLTTTISEFNAHLKSNGSSASIRASTASTVGLTPPKSNWAWPIDTPPFYAYPLRPGITFTYLGVAVDRLARVVTSAGVPIEGVYAAGEIMAGNILLEGYLAGFGMTIGTVFGRIAGREAARWSAACSAALHSDSQSSADAQLP